MTSTCTYVRKLYVRIFSDDTKFPEAAIRYQPTAVRQVANTQHVRHETDSIVMAFPGLSLPGLGQIGSPLPPTAITSALQKPARIETLQPQSEWCFETSFSSRYTIKLVEGNAEIFGTELVINRNYEFGGQSGAIFTWQGCQLEISGDAESEYAAQETGYAIEWLNLHGMLETVRSESQQYGPRTLIVGPDHSGKTSLVKSLAGWAVKVGRTPTLINLDPREGVLVPPSGLAAVTVDSQLDVESGYGISGISGSTITPTKTPLVYSFPFPSSYDRPDYYKAIVTRIALSVTNKLEENPAAKSSGFIIDTPGTLNDPKSQYELIMHIVSEFSIDLVLCIGSERLYNDLTRRLHNGKSAEDGTTILRISKPGATAERSSSFMKQLRTQQTRQYFFGTSKEQLNPHSHTLNFADLSIWRARSVSEQNDTSNAGDDDDEYGNARPRNNLGTFEKIEPSAALTGALLAIKFCAGHADEDSLRDSAVMGFLYVAEVDDARSKIRFLSPHPQRWGDRALIWGSWPEAVPDLVT